MRSCKVFNIIFWSTLRILAKRQGKCQKHFLEMAQVFSPAFFKVAEIAGQFLPCAELDQIQKSISGTIAQSKSDNKKEKLLSRLNIFFDHSHQNYLKETKHNERIEKKQIELFSINLHRIHKKCCTRWWWWCQHESEKCALASWSLVGCCFKARSKTNQTESSSDRSQPARWWCERQSQI